MKKFVALLLLGAALICGGASTGPTYTQQFSYVYALGTNPQYTAGTATAVSANFQGVFYGHFVNDADPTDAHDISVGSTNFDLLAPPYSTQQFTAAGVTANGAQIYALLNAVATTAYGNSQAAAKAAKSAQPK